MDPLLLTLRLVHVVLGSIWVGMVFLTVFFLAPAVQDVGPDGGKVMAAIQKRGLLTWTPVIAVLTLVSGFWLYWVVSMGFRPEYMGSRGGITYGLGGAAATLAFLVGIVVMRPTMLRVTTIMQSLPTMTDERERAARMADVQRLRGRATLTQRIVAALLLLAVATMAVGRYL